VVDTGSITAVANSTNSSSYGLFLFVDSYTPDNIAQIKVDGIVTARGAFARGLYVNTLEAPIFVNVLGQVKTEVGTGYAVELRSTFSGPVSLVNSGTIKADFGVGIGVTTSSTFDFINTGTVSGLVGAINTSQFSSVSKDTVASTNGVIQGDVVLGQRDDVFSMSGGSFVGALDMGSDNDTAGHLQKPFWPELLDRDSVLGARCLV
jgi:hypothetical protein